MFIPSAPLAGYAGYKLFERTYERQFDAFLKTPETRRDIAYFREKSRDLVSADQIVSDRRILTVALGAFGLESEISKKAIIRRILEESPSSPDSFAFRLNDSRWRAFAQAFSFANGPPPFAASAFQERITQRYAERAFERAVGEVDANLRLALNFRREIQSIAAGLNADKIGWLQILGQEPLRRVVEDAFGLPRSLARLDVNRQRAILEQKAQSLFGGSSPAVFKEKENVEIILRRFFLSPSTTDGAAQSSRSAAALALLSELRSSAV